LILELDIKIDHGVKIMGESKATRIIGPLMVISAAFLLVFGIIFTILSFTSRPHIGMGFDEFGAAMQLSSTYSFMGIGMLAGAGFLGLPGLYVFFYGRSSGGKLSFKRTSNLYKNANPYLKGGVVKNKLECPYCQAEIQEGEKVCSECGSEL
jgi:hypothetical protein